MICFGIPSLYSKLDQITTLLRNKLGNGDTKTCVFVPSRTGFHHATVAYIAYDWMVVFAQRNLGPSDFADTPPPGFDDLRREVLSYADDARYQNAVCIVITENQTYDPPELQQRSLAKTCNGLVDGYLPEIASQDAGIQAVHTRYNRGYKT